MDLPLGPVHSSDLGYAFGNPYRLGLHVPTPQGLALSSLMQSYWVNFAKTGDPNGPGLPHSPAFSASSQRVMYLDAHPHVAPVPNLKQIEVFDAYYAHVRRERAAAAGAPAPRRP